MSSEPLIAGSTRRLGARPLAMGDVKLAGFLGERVERNVASMLAGLESPIVHAFETLAAGGVPEERRNNRLSDLYKWLEGAAIAVAYGAGEGIERLAQELARISDLIERANRTIFARELQERYNLYVAGHFFQAAVAHAAATGSHALTDQACEWAEYLMRAFRQGHPSFADLKERSHPCIEMGLVYLGRAVDNKEYLDFAKEAASQFDVTDSVGGLACGSLRRHAVCVEYLLTAMAELQIEEPDSGMLARLRGLWEELVTTRLYVAGGIGYDEIIPELPFDIPNVLERPLSKDVAETCASIGLVMFTRGIHRLTGESRCFDVIETTLYNHLLGALSLDHLAIFYYNPLRMIDALGKKSDLGRSASERTRLPEVHRTSCCISNAWRFLPTLPQYVYSVDDDGLYVNLYTSGSATFRGPDETRLRLDVRTRYPHEGRVTFELHGEREAVFTLRVRIPRWCEDTRITLPDGAIQPCAAGSYHAVRRVWRPGDRVILDLPMAVKVLAGDPRIQATAGCGALMRGPLVYCLENEDAEAPVERYKFAFGPYDAGGVRAEWRPDLLGGLYVLDVPAAFDDEPPAPPGTMPYFVSRPPGRQGRVKMIPFYARANRSQPARWVTWIPFV